MFEGKYLEFKEMHLLEKLHMDDFAHRFVYHDHWRGKGAHLDFRYVREKGGKILDGLTVAHMKAGIATEAVKTVKEAERYAKNAANWKLTNTPEPLRMFAETKAPEPLPWLTYEGVVEKGEVGATKEEYGVFYIRDKGILYYGAQKPAFKEWFLEGSKYDGRWIARLIERRQPEKAKKAFLWQFGKPQDQTPYVLTRRAIRKNWLPPYKVSCLPPQIRKQIPDSLKYWNIQDRRKRFEVRGQLVDSIKKEEVKITWQGKQLERAEQRFVGEAVPYVVQHHWWKKRKLIRAGPSAEHWDLRIETDLKKGLLHFVLYGNPLTATEPIPCYIKPCKDHKWMTIGKQVTYLKPGSPGNPTLDTPAWIYILTSGKVVIVAKSATFYRLQFLSGKMKGLWIIKRGSPSERMWTIERSELPKPK